MVCPEKFEMNICATEYIDRAIVFKKYICNIFERRLQTSMI